MGKELNRKAWYFSGAVHLAFFLLIGLTVLVQLFSKPADEDAFVFEMVAAPSDLPETPDKQPSPAASAILPPEVPEFKVKERIPIEMPDIPAPEEAPATVVEPVVPAKPPPTPSSTESPPKVQPMTVDEFRQRHGQPEPRITPGPAVRKSVAVPPVAVPQFSTPAASTSGSPRTPASSAALNAAYKAKLKNNANLAWDRPRITNSRLLEAKILFTIAPNGTIESVRFEQRSGNAVLDNSAIAAARNTRSPGPPPSGKREIIRIRFVIE